MSKLRNLLWRQRYVVLAVLAIALLLTPFMARYLHVYYNGQAKLLLVGGAGKPLIDASDMGDIATGSVVLGRVRDKFKLPLTLDQFHGYVKAKLAPRSSVMPLIYSDRNPKRAVVVVNAIADETVRYYREIASNQYDEVTRYLQEEMNRQRATIRNDDSMLQNAAQQDESVGSASALETITARLTALETERGAAYATLVSNRAIAAAQASQGGAVAGVIRNQVLDNDPYANALKANVGKDATALDIVKSQYKDSYPGMPGLQEQVAREKAALSSAQNAALQGPPTSSSVYGGIVLDTHRAQAVESGDVARVAALDAQIATERGHLANLPRLGVTVNGLRVQRDAAQAVYTSLSMRLTQTKQAAAESASLGTVVVMDYALNAPARLPQWAIDLLFAFALFFAATSVAYLIDQLDPRARASREAQRVYGGAYLGSVG